MSNAAYALATVVWVGLIVAYLRQGPRQIVRDLRDPVLAPFVTAAPITGMVLSLALAQFSFDALVVRAFMTVLILAIAARTVVALIQHTFLPAAHIGTEPGLEHSHGR